MMALLNTGAVAEALRFQPDVVLSAHIVVAPAAWTIARAMGTPYVQYLHGEEVAAKSFLARFAARHATSVIAVSAYTASLVANAVREGQLHRIPPGVDESRAPSVPRAEQPLIITVARLVDRYKGHDVMLRALPLIRARVPDAQWIVIGDGPLRELFERTAATMGLTNGVRFLGAVTDQERDQWLDQARVFAMPSRLSAAGGGEGFGIVYLEAGTHMLPVVAGNVGGAVEAVEHGVTGLLVDPTDPLAVADAVVSLLSDRPRAEALGRAGAARAKDYSWPSIAKQVEAVLHEVAGREAA
jgi:phosphatidylinositol alpha-1,6-mannosyltransferase